MNDTMTLKIEQATMLHRQLKELTERVEALKTEIREDAARRCAKTGANQVEYQTSLGVCTVVMVKDAVRFAKGAVPIELRNVLPEKVWNGLFQTEVVFNKESFEEVYEGLSKAQSRLLNGVVEWKSCEPRVTFPK